MKVMVINVNDVERNMLKTLTETETRSKSNTKRLDEIKHDVEELHEENKALYRLTTSVELIAQEMTTTKDLIQNVDHQLKDVSGKVEALERKPYEDYEKTKSEIKTKVIVTVISTIAISGLSVLGTLIVSNVR